MHRHLSILNSSHKQLYFFSLLFCFQMLTSAWRVTTRAPTFASTLWAPTCVTATERVTVWQKTCQAVWVRHRPPSCQLYSFFCVDALQTRTACDCEYMCVRACVRRNRFTIIMPTWSVSSFIFLSPFSPAVFIIQGVSELQFDPFTVTRTKTNQSRGRNP